MTLKEAEKLIESLKREIHELKTKAEKEAVKELKTAAKTDDFEGYSGQYKHIATGEIFMLKVVEPEGVRGGRTHLAKNKTSFGDYTAAEFRAQFDKL